MRLGLYGWAAIAAAVILGLAAIAVRRPLAEALYGQRSDTSMVVGMALASSSSSADRLSLEVAASGFAGPVDMQFLPGSPDRAVILEKEGRARLISLPTGEQSGPDVINLKVHTESELGLLGLAFHPRYVDNGLFYLNTNPRDDGPLRTRIDEWHWPLDAVGKAPARQTRVLLEIKQPFKNHDGGQVAFGPDGYLYIGMGDGGSRADPQNHGQNLSSLLGKMLRIDVNSEPGYAVPPDNPFVQRPDVRPEIWAYGLRNPWRFTFDPRGRLIAADVGQDAYEEVDLILAGDNLGWKVREGAHCFFPAEGCDAQGMVEPIFEYGREQGQSITGGHVYLGKRLPWLSGKYVFGDFVTGRLWALDLPERGGEPARVAELGQFSHAFSAFARAPDGELYALDFARGTVLRLVPG